MKIVAPGLGKFKRVSCMLDTATNQTEFLTLSTDRTYLRTMLKNYQPDLVVFEACSVAACGCISPTRSSPGPAATWTSTEPTHAAFLNGHADIEQALNTRKNLA